MKKSIILLAIVCLLPACTMQKTKLIQPVDIAQVQHLAEQMPNEFRSLGFTDDENHWYSPVVSLPIMGIGETLYNHLDPSFHYGSSMNISSFKNLGGQNLILSPNKFYFEKGSDRFTGELIALLDWNDDGKDDWLVVFSLTNITTKEAARKYYLIITDTNNYPLQSQSIASIDGLDNIFKVLVQIGNHNSEYEIGSSNILQAPTDTKKGTPSDENVPTKLSE